MNMHFGSQTVSDIWVGAGIAIVLLVLLSIALIYRTRSKRKKPELAPAEPFEPAKAKPQVPAEPILTEDQRVSKGLSRTKVFFQQAMDRLFSHSEGAQFFEEMEEVLLTADVGLPLSDKIITSLRSEYGVKLPVRTELHNKLSQILVQQIPQKNFHVPSEPRPYVIMVVGVNGAGKTTTIAKLCQRFQSQNLKVLVGAADTFRAAAVEQLKTWVERVGADGVFQKEGTDPSAVGFDSVQAAVARKADVCIIDTAGRLHTKTNLMEELKKMKRVLSKAMSSAPHEVWLVIDGSMGQNALHQAREFHQHLDLSGVVVTKLDGSSKGGSVIAIASELQVPVYFIGVGESPEDLVPFEGKHFVDSILAGL